MPHGLALDVLPLDYYHPKNPAEREKTGSLGIDLFTLCAQTVSRKAWCTYEMGSRILLGLTPKSLRYHIWKKLKKK